MNHMNYPPPRKEIAVISPTNLGEYFESDLFNVKLETKSPKNDSNGGIVAHMVHDTKNDSKVARLDTSKNDSNVGGEFAMNLISQFDSNGDKNIPKTSDSNGEGNAPMSDSNDTSVILGTLVRKKPRAPENLLACAPPPPLEGMH